MTLNTYYVCSLPLHKEIYDHDGTKSLQAYKPGSKVELTEEQAVKYKHLIETQEQVDSRVPKTTKK
jgi:chaperone required for assembly of F1-ATPase